MTLRPVWSTKRQPGLYKEKPWVKTKDRGAGEQGREDRSAGHSLGNRKAAEVTRMKASMVKAGQDRGKLRR